MPAALRYALAGSRRTPVSSWIRRSGHPRRPSATTCCFFSSLKTLPIRARSHAPPPFVNVSSPQLRWPVFSRPSLAGFGRSPRLERLKKLDPPVPIRRYEKTRLGELVHLDIKKLGRVKGLGHRITGHHVGVHRSRGIGWEYVHVCVDDFTRLAYVEVLADEKGITTAAFLRRAAAWLAEQGVTAERVMTDNGSGYVSKDFAAALAAIRARHLRTRPYTPRTNGKAERFIQTMLREWAYGRPYQSSSRCKGRTARLAAQVQ